MNVCATLEGFSIVRGSQIVWWFKIKYHTFIIFLPDFDHKTIQLYVFNVAHYKYILILILLVAKMVIEEQAGVLSDAINRKSYGDFWMVSYCVSTIMWGGEGHI